MKQLCFQIGHIPTILWGAPSDKLILTVHGTLTFYETWLEQAILIHKQEDFL